MKRFAYVEKDGQRLYVECEDNTTPPPSIFAHKGQLLSIFHLEAREK